MRWRIIDSGSLDGATNMAIDEAMLAAHAMAKVPPTLRLYGWRPPALTLGYFQRAQAEIDLEACRQAGIDVIRRLTGGRAVLHDCELTYSVVVREDHPLLPKTIMASYRLISAGLLAGLKRLGVDAQLSVPRAADGQTRKRTSSSACFDATSSYELTVDGRKLVGSAQVRRNGVLLQHGSLLLGFSPEKVVSLLQLPTPEKRAVLQEKLAGRATSLAEVLHREVGWQEACDALGAAFGSTLEIQLEPGTLSAAEAALAEDLARTKYRQDSWNLMK